MKGKKTSSEKIVEVLTAKLMNPDLSVRDLESETWVPKSIVWRTIEEEMGQTGTQEKKNILFDANLDIINTWVEKIRLAMKRLDPETIHDTSEYQWIVERAFKQNLLIEWKPTEITKLDLSNVKNKTTEEILEGIKNAL